MEILNIVENINALDEKIKKMEKWKPKSLKGFMITFIIFLIPFALASFSKWAFANRTLFGYIKAQFGWYVIVPAFIMMLALWVIPYLYLMITAKKRDYYRKEIEFNISRADSLARDEKPNDWLQLDEKNWKRFVYLLSRREIALNFNGMDFTNINSTRWLELTDCFDRKWTMQNCKFDSMNLRDVNFEGIDLKNSSFKNANLGNCKFGGSDLTNCDFTNASIINAYFDTAILVNVKIDQSALATAISREHLENDAREREQQHTVQMQALELNRLQEFENAKAISKEIRRGNNINKYK